MTAEPRWRVLSLFWGFAVGGVAQYATKLEGIPSRAPIDLRTFCVLTQGRQVDVDSLTRLRDRVVVQRGGLFDFRWFAQLREQLRTWQPNALLSHGFNCHFLSHLAFSSMDRRPLVLCSYHGGYHPPTRLRRLLAPVFNGYTNHFLRRHADAVVAVAEHAKEALVGERVAAERITVIHNGLPDCEVPPDQASDLRRQWGIPEDAIVVGLASRLERIKGIDHAIRAVAQLGPGWPALRLVIVGAGPVEPELRGLVRALDLTDRVEFVGYRSDIPICMAAFDIFLLPSLVEHHSIGLLEAMRAGKAIVATTVGGNPESVADEQEALLVPPADSGALAAAMRRYLADPGLRARLGRAARARFLQCFTDDRMIQRTADWMLAALEGQKAA